MRLPKLTILFQLGHLCEHGRVSSPIILRQMYCQSGQRILKSDKNKVLIPTKNSRRTLGSVVEHGAIHGTTADVVRRFHHAVFRVRCMGPVYVGDPGHDGGSVRVPAHPASPLGRIYEQILRRIGLRFPAVFIQIDS
uniref:(northern house mosquito) hypothetical protein n=1 Tax=Culex pipiens TaxID=7175 RepID=A0A8D8CCI5_CULPI